MNQTIKHLFERAAELMNFPTSAMYIPMTVGAPTRGKVYSNEYLKMDYNPYYGGYRIDIVMTNSGERDFDGMSRKTKKEMESYLRGLIKGLTYKQ